MLKALRLLIVVLILILPSEAFSTHIVGGSLTYVHNGGSSYTVTLKLYRDCGPSSANFPSSTKITVLGLN